MAALPYIQLYVADYLADTMHLTTEEHGAYLLLIFNYWQTGKPIPKSRLSRIARLSNDRWESVEISLSEFFNDNGNEWEHKRIEADLQIVAEAQAQRSAAGKASAEARKRAKTAKKKQEVNDRSATVEGSSERNNNEKSTNKDTDTDTDTDTDKTHRCKKSDSEENPKITKAQLKKLHPEIEPNLIDEWWIVRKDKKANSLTKTAWENFTREAGKASLTLNDTMKICVKNHWRGFEASWLINQQSSAKPGGAGNVSNHNQHVLQEWLDSGEPH